MQQYDVMIDSYAQSHLLIYVVAIAVGLKPRVLLNYWWLTPWDLNFCSSKYWWLFSEALGLKPSVLLSHGT
jgi:hypothetical protein